MAKQSAHEKYLKCRAWSDAKGGYYQKYMKAYNEAHREESRQTSREYRKTHVYMLIGKVQVWVTPAQARILEPLRPQYRSLEAIKPSALRRVEADMAEEKKAREAQDGIV